MYDVNQILADVVGARHAEQCLAASHFGHFAAAGTAVLSNTRSVQLLWGVVHISELAVVNAIEEAMVARHFKRHGTRNWLDEHLKELGSLSTQVLKARHDLDSRGLAATHDNLLARLTFGFWCRLLGREFQTTLWPDLRCAFPHMPGRDRRVVSREVERVRQARNHLAHRGVVTATVGRQYVCSALTTLSFIEPRVIAPLIRALDIVPPWLGDCWATEADG